MPIVTVMSIDPSLRNTGIAVVEYNCDISPSDPRAYKVQNCQVLCNPIKYKGTDAILNMIDMMKFESKKDCYSTKVDVLLVESPSVIFSQNNNWAAGTAASLAHISGAAVAVFGVEKAYLYRPVEWNRRKKKEVTHAQTQSFLSDWRNWHYEKPIKSEKYLEHVMDAASMALWWIKTNYVESES
jgi:hypothetical protein